MYLHKRVYVGNKWRKPEQQLKIKYPKNEKDASFPVRKGTINEKKISSIEEEVAYWRKANQIHDWFVQNVQGGVDECQESYVDPEKIDELVGLCKQVLKETKTNKPLPRDTKNWSEWKDIKIKNPEVCERLLPTSEGFFFGNTNYDGNYLCDIKQTIEQLEPLTAKDEKGFYNHSGDLYYSASW